MHTFQGQWDSLLQRGRRSASPCTAAENFIWFRKRNVTEPLTHCLHFVFLVFFFSPAIPQDARFRQFFPRQFCRHFYVPRPNQHIRPIVTGSILLGTPVTIIRDIIKTDFPFM